MRLANVSITIVTLLLTMILLAACEAHTETDACAWLRPIDPNPGFETRWTRDEKNQIDAYDRAFDANCGKGL